MIAAATRLLRWGRVSVFEFLPRKGKPGRAADLDAAAELRYPPRSTSSVTAGARCRLCRCSSASRPRMRQEIERDVQVWSVLEKRP